MNSTLVIAGRSIRQTFAIGIAAAFLAWAAPASAFSGMPPDLGREARSATSSLLWLAKVICSREHIGNIIRTWSCNDGYVCLPNHKCGPGAAMLKRMQEEAAREAAREAAAAEAARRSEEEHAAQWRAYQAQQEQAQREQAERERAQREQAEREQAEAENARRAEEARQAEAAREREEAARQAEATRQLAQKLANMPNPFASAGTQNAQHPANPFEGSSTGPDKGPEPQHPGAAAAKPKDAPCTGDFTSNGCAPTSSPPPPPPINVTIGGNNNAPTSGSTASGNAGSSGNSRNVPTPCQDLTGRYGCSNGPASGYGGSSPQLGGQQAPQQVRRPAQAGQVGIAVRADIATDNGPSDQTSTNAGPGNSPPAPSPDQPQQTASTGTGNPPDQNQGASPDGQAANQQAARDKSRACTDFLRNSVKCSSRLSDDLGPQNRGADDDKGLPANPSASGQAGAFRDCISLYCRAAIKLGCSNSDTESLCSGLQPAGAGGPCAGGLPLKPGQHLFFPEGADKPECQDNARDDTNSQGGSDSTVTGLGK